MPHRPSIRSPLSRRRAAAVIAAALLSTVAGEAVADGFDKTAYDLYQQCDTVTSRFLQGVCLGYIGAVVGAAQAVPGDDPAFCLAADTTPQQVRRQFMADIEARAVDRSAPAHSAIAATLAARYPCGEATAPTRPVDPPAPEDLGLQESGEMIPNASN